MLYIQQCAKIQLNLQKLPSFCAEVVPVEVTSVSSELHIKSIDLISRVIYRNYTLKMCNGIYPSVFELSNRYHTQNKTDVNSHDH